MYDARYLPLAIDKGDWWYVYTSIFKNYYWNKV